MTRKHNNSQNISQLSGYSKILKILKVKFKMNITGFKINLKVKNTIWNIFIGNNSRIKIDLEILYPLNII